MDPRLPELLPHDLVLDLVEGQLAAGGPHHALGPRTLEGQHPQRLADVPDRLALAVTVDLFDRPRVVDVDPEGQPLALIPSLEARPAELFQVAPELARAGEGVVVHPPGLGDVGAEEPVESRVVERRGQQDEERGGEQERPPGTIVPQERGGRGVLVLTQQDEEGCAGAERPVRV